MSNCNHQKESLPVAGIEPQFLWEAKSSHSSLKGPSATKLNSHRQTEISYLLGSLGFW